MTKAKYPRAIKENVINKLGAQAEELSGSLEHWLQCRQDRLQAQSRLLQSCKTEADVNRYKAEGLLDFGSENILSEITRTA
jgi:hypothetical protein